MTCCCPSSAEAAAADRCCLHHVPQGAAENCQIGGRRRHLDRHHVRAVIQPVHFGVLSQPAVVGSTHDSRASSSISKSYIYIYNRNRTQLNAISDACGESYES